MRRFTQLFVLAALAVWVCSASTFYVATNGNDAWSGTLPAPNSANSDGPFKTLYKAQSSMNSSSTIKTVTIRGGTYTLTANLSFFSSSNGQTWIPFQNETPIIDGASLYDLKGSGVSNVTIEGLTFQHMNSNLSSSVGMGISGDHLTIRWNTFLGCHRYCIVGIMTNSLIDSNHMNGQSPGQDAGCSSPTYAAIQNWPGSTNVTISHNLSENMQGGPIAIQANHFTVDRNKILNVNTNLCDWGAIYVNHDVNQPFTISNNYIDGNGGVNFASDQTKAIYLDDVVSNATVSGNICRSCGSDALQIHGGTNNLITNNIFDLSTGVHAMALYQTSPVAATGMTGNVFQKNIIYSSCSVPQLWVISLLAGNALPTVSHNLYYSGCGASIPNTGAVDSSPTYGNPQFSDPSNGDYAMPSTSPAFTSIGFQALPTDQGPLPSPFVTGANPQSPTISSFTASPSSISSGASSTLAWAASGATSLSINQGVGTVTGLTSTPVSPTSSTAFTLTASNSAGSVTRSLTVTVAGTGLPTISSFTASPSTITAGGASSLAWSVSGATSLSVNQGVGTVTGTSTSVSPVISTAFTLTATNSAGSVSRTVTVNVLSASTLVSPRQAAIF
jgi:hypothetical protein